MLDICRDMHPRMHSTLIDGERRTLKLRIGESTHRNGHTVRLIFNGVEDRRTTLWAKAEGDPSSGIPNAYVLPGYTSNVHRFVRESRLRTEDTARSALTRKTMTHRDPHWVTDHVSSKVTAAA
jgi:hypothetical protein